jgi:hypothetical protein
MLGSDDRTRVRVQGRRRTISLSPSSPASVRRWLTKTPQVCGDRLCLGGKLQRRYCRSCTCTVCRPMSHKVPAKRSPPSFCLRSLTPPASHRPSHPAWHRFLSQTPPARYSQGHRRSRSTQPTQQTQLNIRNKIYPGLLIRFVRGEGEWPPAEKPKQYERWHLK